MAYKPYTVRSETVQHLRIYILRLSAITELPCTINAVTEKQKTRSAI